MPELNLTSLKTALKDSLLEDAASVFSEYEDDETSASPYERHINAALRDFDRLAPRIERDCITLSQSEAQYIAPANAYRFQATDYTEKLRHKEPWGASAIGYPVPQRLPLPTLHKDPDGKYWRFSFAPTAAMINVLGSTYEYSYFAYHQLSPDENSYTSLYPEDEPLVLLRAQAEAMKELAVRNSSKPVEIRGSSKSASRNGPPEKLFQALMREFETQMGARMR